MDRRLTGAAVLLVALLGVGVMSGLNGSKTSGSPVAEAIPPPPTIGDCVTGDVQTIGDMWAAMPLQNLDLPVKACPGTRDAEVVSIIDDFAAVTRISADRADRPSAAQGCFTAALNYLQVGPGSPTKYGQWTPAVRFGVGLIGPSDRQLADGQTWAACVVYANTLNEGPTGNLTGSVRNVFVRSLPDTARFGICLAQPLADEMSCARPHHVEVFAEMIFPLPIPDQADLLRSCQEVVAGQTLMPDPTAGGALTAVVSIDPDRTLSFEDGTPGQLAQCTVLPTDPGRTLTSTLRQLGTGALPLD